MSIRQNRYGFLICRSLLLAGYLFLFAGQFSYRYFSLANFYIYGNGGTGSRAQLNTKLNTEDPARHAAGIQQLTRVEHGVALHNNLSLHDNGERATHLCIDKRFDVKKAVRVPQIRAPGLLHYTTIVKTRRPTLTPDCTSTDLPFTSLRGPPCA
jgi:hypothetical protein